MTNTDYLQDIAFKITIVLFVLAFLGIGIYFIFEYMQGLANLSGIDFMLGI